MSVWIASTLAIAMTAATAITAANAGCVAKGSNRCVDTGSGVDLNSVSDIASKIVSEEPIGKKQDKPAGDTTAPAIYTGPIFGAAPGKRAPTVGYSWSLE